MKREAPIGQELWVDFFQHAASAKQMEHAYLFSAPKGSGKRSLADYTAQLLLCLEGTGCGTCASCTAWRADTHPDLLVVDDVEGSISIEAMQQVRVFVQHKPLVAPHKVVVVDAVDAATHEAVNALLKTLEEPAGHAVLLLLTHRIEELLPTIVSRCQLVPLAPVAAEALAQAFPDISPTVIGFAAGRAGVAVALGQEQEKFEQTLLDMLHLLQAPLVDRFAWVEREITAATSALWVDRWAVVVRDLYYAHLGLDERMVLQSCAAHTKQIATTLPLRAITEAWRFLVRTAGRRRLGKNWTLVFENFFLFFP